MSLSEFFDGVPHEKERKQDVHLFYGGPLGNWCRSPFSYKTRDYGLVTFSCVEQFMMLYKALFFKERDIADRILMGPVSPKEYKKLGRMIGTFDMERWKTVCMPIVTTGCWHKFIQNEKHRRALINTKQAILAEASRKDKVWGIGMYASDLGADDPSNWTGENRLGVCLTAVRSRLYAHGYV